METPLTKSVRQDGETTYLHEYVKAGGYQGLRKALTKMSPAGVQKEVKDSTLRGRGGAGFSTGVKWSLIPMGGDAPHPKYVVVNADEMEPGTFKDRFLLEHEPHQLIEGTLLCAYAVNAGISYVFLRREYRSAAGALSRAIQEAYEAGYLGQNILGSGFGLEMVLHTSSGRYMCGEETGLLNSLEGRRAIPRSKPPHPTTCGLWAKPTIMNNVETLCNVPHIVLNGAAWYKGLSLSADGGTKLFGASGRVRKPGLWELPMGTPLREILEEHAGGMRDGFTFRGLLPGGASTDFLVEQHLDTRMDFESVQKAGSRLGTGTMIVMDDKTCPVGMVLNLERFFARESCGWCTPCRDGLPWTVHLLEAIEEGRGEYEDIEVLESHTKSMGPGRTFCPLAPGAMEPLQSALRYFRDDFERHIKQKRCPWR